ncbi:hypothetical protein LTR27_007304 [Elasticomyces elasticus]|nr:hypothetical protein LTR27_007304 [Elasticomyces elasticus]
MEYRTPDYDPKPSAPRDTVAFDARMDRDERRRLVARRGSQRQFVENRRVESDINPPYLSDDPRPHPRWEPLAYNAWFDRGLQRRLAARKASNKQIAENRPIMDYRVPADDPKPSALRNPRAYRAWLDRDDRRVIAFEDRYLAERGNIENRRVESDINSAFTDHDPQPSALRNPSGFRAWLDREYQRKMEALIACYEKCIAELRRAENSFSSNMRPSTYAANRHKLSQSLNVSKRLPPRQANVQRSSVTSHTRKTTVKRSVPLIHDPNGHVRDARSRHLVLHQRAYQNAGSKKDTIHEEIKQTDVMLPTLSDEYVLTTTAYNSAAEFQAAEPSKYVEAQKVVFEEAMRIGRCEREGGF